MLALQTKFLVSFRSKLRMNLINKKCSNKAKLIEQQSDGLSIFGNKNHLSSFDNDTKILIVGTYIPYYLDYFYFGKYTHRIYGSIIDVARKTNFEEKRKKILESDTKEELIQDFIEELKRQKIAFLDLFEFTLINSNVVADNEIKGFTIDNDSFKKVKTSKNLKCIIPISKDAERILKSILGDDPRIEYHQLINGGTNKEWIEVFSRTYF